MAGNGIWLIALVLKRIEILLRAQWAPKFWSQTFTPIFMTNTLGCSLLVLFFFTAFSESGFCISEAGELRVARMTLWVSYEAIKCRSWSSMLGIATSFFCKGEDGRWEGWRCNSMPEVTGQFLNKGLFDSEPTRQAWFQCLLLRPLHSIKIDRFFILKNLTLKNKNNFLMILGKYPLDTCLVSHNKQVKKWHGAFWKMNAYSYMWESCFQNAVWVLPLYKHASTSVFSSSFLHCGMGGKIIERLVV
jgi:hypothetical protein